MTYSITIGEFSAFCGPQAVAAVANITPMEAAAALRALYPGVSSHVSPDQVVAVLGALGWHADEAIRPSDGGRVRVAGLATSRGRWLVSVPSGGISHALVLEDGRIVAGDPFNRFGWHPVRRAWHITPNPTPEAPPVMEVDVDREILGEDDPKPRHSGLIGRVKLLDKRDVQGLPDFLQQEVRRQLKARRASP